MKVLIINGSPHEKGCTYTALKEVMDILEAEGIETILYHVDTKVDDCKACHYCYKAGRCVIADDVNRLADILENEADGIIVGSPVYFAGMSGSLTALMDRLFYITHGTKLRLKACAAVTSSRRAGNGTTFDAINKYFMSKGMVVIGSSYWNEVHGNTPEEVLQDEEGMQCMRNLGRQMAYYLKIKKRADEQGVELPYYEKDKKTNFVR